MTDPKRTTELSEIFVSDDARTIRVPRFEDLDAPTTRTAARKVTLTCGDRRASFTLDSFSTTGANLTGPLTFSVGDRISMTLDIAGEPLTLAAEIVDVATIDLLSDEVAVRFLEIGAAARERIATLG